MATSRTGHRQRNRADEAQHEQDGGAHDHAEGGEGHWREPAGRTGGDDVVRSQAGRCEEPPRDAHDVDAQPAPHVEDEDETAEGQHACQRAWWHRAGGHS